MSDFAQGDGPDVNTDAGFTAFLAAQVGAELSPEQSERIAAADSSVNQGLSEGRTVEEAPQERPRDPETGRFLPAGTQPPAEEAPPTDAGQASPDTNWEERYRNLESAFGRQGQEMGERIARLEGQLQAQTQQPPQPEPFPSYGEDTEERLQSMIEAQGGPAVMDQVYRNWPHLAEVAERIFAEEDPVLYPKWAGYMGAQMAAAEQTPASTPAPPSEELKRVEFRERYEPVISQLSEEDRQVLAANLEAVTKAAPAFVRNAFTGDNAEDRLAATRYLVAMARSIGGAPVRTPEQEAATVAAKQATMVGTGSQRPVAPGDAQGGDVDLDSLSPEERTAEITRRFHEQLFQTETTSVSEGLTRGREGTPA